MLLNKSSRHVSPARNDRIQRHVFLRFSPEETVAEERVHAWSLRRDRIRHGCHGLVTLRWIPLRFPEKCVDLFRTDKDILSWRLDGNVSRDPIGGLELWKQGERPWRCQNGWWVVRPLPGNVLLVLEMGWDKLNTPVQTLLCFNI